MLFFARFFHQRPKEFRAFELLRSGLDRSKYLLVKEAKIIAMTCTHAALKRHDLVELAFKVFLRTVRLNGTASHSRLQLPIVSPQYDNILMEEAAQILEIETFIPLLLQVKSTSEMRVESPSRPSLSAVGFQFSM